MKIILRMTTEAKKYKLLLIISAISTMLLTIVNLVAPKLMAEITALVAQGLDDADLRRTVTLSFILLGLYTLRILFRYLSNYMANKAAWSLVKELRLRVYCKLQSLSMDYYRSNESGDLVSRTMNDTATFAQVYAHLIPESITNIITLTGVVVILLSINARLALLTFLPIPFILLGGWIFAAKIRPHFRETHKSLGKLYAQLQDNFSGMQEIQAFGQQSEFAKKVEYKTETFTRFMLRALKLSAAFHPSIEFLTALGIIIVTSFGGYLAYLEQLQVGDIVAFLLYLSLFYAPITWLTALVEQMQQALAGAERVIEILDAPETIKNASGALPLKNPQGALCFKNVSFSYFNNVPILRNVSFEVEQGKMVAIVGATGVGKSTLAQLIARFYDPTSGVIQIDGCDLRDIDIDSLHQNVAMVLQDTFLFNGTIAENIAFARPDASVEEIEQASRIARIHEDILGLSDGYETMVGERGARLSGGQKQRIAIARAVLSKAPVLVLDEATASVDVQTEVFIQKAIMELVGTHTIIVITHRLSTVRRADCILVLEHGRITQQGTHETLSTVPGLYREMCRIQEQGIFA